MVFVDSGLFSPSLDDAIRLLILAVAVVNVAVLVYALRCLSRNTRLLLDIEQFAREVRLRKGDEMRPTSDE
jgi:hypothetical protein